MVIVFRCAQGPVGWILKRDGQDSGHAMCIVDGLRLPMSRHADASWETQLLAMANHSIGLKGPLQEIIYLPSEIS
jgi:hypothetical protein